MWREIFQQLVQYETIDGTTARSLLTSPEIRVEQLKFIPTASGRVPRVTVIMKGVATNKEKLTSDFLLQTTLSQRNF